MTDTVKLIECPRDAWQGLPEIIPTETKVNYLRELVAAGFQHIDAVSFVSPKHVKQMSDSEEVMGRLLDSLPDGATLQVDQHALGPVVDADQAEQSVFRKALAPTKPPQYFEEVGGQYAAEVQNQPCRWNLVHPSPSAVA